MFFVPPTDESARTGRFCGSWHRRFHPKDWAASLSVYREKRLIAILLMGFSSGLPLALTGATLSLRLADLGVSLTAIGLFTLVRFSYSFKFLWSPLIDRLPIPWLTARLGRRRGWALAIQAALALAILALGLDRPECQPVVDGACRGRRRVSVGQPGHRHRRLPHRIVARRRSRAPVPRRPNGATGSACWRPAPGRSTPRVSPAGALPTG